MDIIFYLPHVLAILNASTVLLLICGYYFIRNNQRDTHRTFMLSASAVAAIFMVCYLVYHAKVGYIPFAGEGAIRPYYFTILASHVILAAIAAPLILITLILALRGKFTSHRRFARWLFPLWLYVSISGLSVYFLSFHLYPN